MKTEFSLRRREKCLGTWLSVGSPVIAEIAAASGFDWLLFDLEHGCYTESALLSNFQAINGTTAAPIVRVGALQPELISRVLDWGASGIMLPHVSEPEEAERCVRAMRYAPRGGRGFSRTVRTYGYGNDAPDFSGEVPDPFFFAQIETMRGVENAEKIASVDGVGALFVGPADLQYELTKRNQPAESYQQALVKVAAAAANAGKSCGILARDPADVKKLGEMGYTHVALTSDIGILRGAYQDLVKNA